MSFNPDQPRDDHGEWSEGGGAAGDHAAKAEFHRAKEAEHNEAARQAQNAAMLKAPHTDGYDIQDKNGNSVGWERHSKDAKYHAEQIGGKAKKIKAPPKAEAHTTDQIKMPDGSFAPMNKANIAAATKHWYGKKG